MSCLPHGSDLPIRYLRTGHQRASSVGILLMYSSCRVMSPELDEAVAGYCITIYNSWIVATRPGHDLWRRTASVSSYTTDLAALLHS